MSLKSIISRILVLVVMLISVFLTSITEAASLNLNVANSSVAVASKASYTYERVLIDGVWWIIVYGEDGAVIETYVDPVQD